MRGALAGTSHSKTLTPSVVGGHSRTLARSPPASAPRAARMGKTRDAARGPSGAGLDTATHAAMPPDRPVHGRGEGLRPPSSAVGPVDARSRSYSAGCRELEHPRAQRFVRLACGHAL